MKRTTRPSGTRRHTVSAVVLMLAAVTSSVAAADDGDGPLGVTVEADDDARSARVGALFHSADLDSDHFCTASVVHSAGRDLILTAAHCLDGGGALFFVPGYRDGRAPYGVWEVGQTYVSDTWSGTRDEDSDLAFAAVGRLAGAGVEDVVGGNAFVTGRATGSTAVTVTGYPKKADAPITCTNKPTAAAHSRTTHSRTTQQRIECPGFPGGTSGSPWINGDGRLVGLIGGHEEGGSTADVSYSVVLGAEAAALYRRAGGAA
ncbi:trypsin-like serine peptidase [Streptomyces sp. NPDC059785]|uniref:trypsin-like serine peptidase n=1 Tax=unclassified Streptomyces TaxID=2593676 RepID=UPI00366577C7